MFKRWNHFLVVLTAIFVISAGFAVSADDAPPPEDPQPATSADPKEPAPAAKKETPPAKKAADKEAPATEEKPAAPAKEAAPKPEKEADKEAAPDAPADSAPQAAYEQKLTQWKEILKKLREIRVSYQNADDENAKKLQADWDKTVAQGNQLLPQLRDAATDAYIAAPESDRQLSRFVFKLAGDAYKRDEFEAARKIAEAMLAAGAESKSLYGIAGVCAFVLNDFDVAEKRFEEFNQAEPKLGKGAELEEEDFGKLFQTVGGYESVVDDYKKYWAEEQALRKKEAEADDLPRILMKTTKGDIEIELFENEAPMAVANFISLVKEKFYDGLTFHRVLDGFMAQGGCPVGDGSGGPGYKIPCESHQDNYRKHFRGSISMAHAGRDTGGSQFFLTFTPAHFLNEQHTVFGRIIKGMDVLAKLQRRDPDAKPPLPTPDRMLSVEVIRDRGHEYKPTKVQ